MNILLVLFSLVVTISAIRVPTVWPNENVHRELLNPIVHESYLRKSVRDRSDFRIYPHKSKIRKNHHHVHRRPLKISKLPPRVQHYHKKPKKFLKKQKIRQSKWTPVAPFSISTTLGYMPPTPNLTFDFRQFPKTHYTPASSEYVTSRSSPLFKNYRDDRTYEQETKDEKITKPLPDVDRPAIKESDHEDPSDIPASPIYPGEGEWAKPGKKHRPYVSKQKYTQAPEESEEKPDGYEIFEKGEKLFDNKHANFVDIRENKYPETKSEDQNARQEEVARPEEEAGSSADEDGFVPTTLYAQVRRSEDEKHLPSDADDSEGGRLKEVVKDSKILTVYTEEGYEDSAYDHAGHEKEAEDSQGYKEYNKEEEKKHKPKGSSKQHRLKTDDQKEDGSTKIYKTITNPKKSKRKKYTPKNKNIYNKLIQTESTRMMKLKEEPDGTQMEITREIKTITNPHNNKTERIVQIQPKIVKISDTPVPNHELYLNSSEFAQEGPIIEPSTTPPSRKIRKKRYANDFPQFDVKTDFIDGIIKNDIPNLNEQIEKTKYPYYKSEYINRNSPLKYSENIDNIPVKTQGHMAFYEQANRVQCPEIDEDIEAIPKRIKEVEKSVNSGEKIEDSEDAGRSPRLGNLGQRIDCFKRKYFGENPLDSPFFKEKEIEAVPPLFKVLQERSAGFQAHHVKTREPISPNSKKRYHSKFRNFKTNKVPPAENEDHNPANSVEELDSDEIVNDVRYHDQPETLRRNNLRQSPNNAQFAPQVEIINVDTFKSIDQVTTVPSVSLITTPNYSIDITPNHIYDQIKLLEFLPSQPLTTVVSTTEENPRKGKNFEETATAAQLQMRPNPNFQNYVPRRTQRIKKKRPHFDVDSFIRDQSRRVTIIPNSYNTENDAVYNEQTPLDQMNVFADVLNNIKNGSNDPLRVEASNYNIPEHVNSYTNPVVKMRVPPKRINIKIPDTEKYSYEKNIYHTTTPMPTTERTTTKKSRRGSIRFGITTEKEINYDDFPETDDESDYGRKKISVKTSTSAFPQDDAYDDEDSEASGSHTTETVQKPQVKKNVDIIGLVPPSKYHYRTIYQPVEELVSEPVVAESEVVNNYHVLGMKPPSTKQKIYDYNDFHRIFSTKNAKNHKYHNISHRRGKRSPNRKSYFEVVRGQGSNDEEPAPQEEDDDYVPHRPKNWHWDETLKKIVYDKPKEQEEEDENDEEIEVVEIEVEDSIPKNIQQTTTRRSITSTTPLNGPSYVDFVQLLRSKKDYVSIPDPTTKKEGIKMETTPASTTTVRTDPTKAPEFLSFVSKLRQSDSYKLIEEKNKTKTTTTTTELPEEDEDIDDTETALSNVQNSPGRGAVDIGQNFKIFDVNEFMPKVKTYSPRTEIDYSKYKTIQRPRPKTTTEANKEEEENNNSEVENPNPSFIIRESEDPPSVSSTEGKLEIFERSRPTTPSTTTTSTTTVKIQRTRRRRPTTTQRTVAASASNTKEDIAPVPANKSKRFYPRIRQPHIRTRTTTPKTEESIEDEDAVPDESRKVIIRRQNTGERSPKIISLEEIIKMDQPEKSIQQASFRSGTKPSNKSEELTVDDILKNINRLKEISVEEVVPDYSLDTKSETNDEENTESKDEYFEDENSKIALDSSGTTNRKLVISKDKQQGMIYYTSVR